jgi:hypothetical protein
MVPGLANGTAATYTLYDLAGRIVFSQQGLSQSLTSVQTPNLRAGLYYLQVQARGQAWVATVQIL